MADAKGRNREVGEDEYGDEGQGQKRAYLFSLLMTSSANHSHRNAGKLHKKPKPQFIAFD